MGMGWAWVCHGIETSVEDIGGKWGLEEPGTKGGQAVGLRTQGQRRSPPLCKEALNL